MILEKMKTIFHKKSVNDKDFVKHGLYPKDPA